MIVGSSLQINKETVLQQESHATVAVRQGMASMSVASNTPPVTNVAKWGTLLGCVGVSKIKEAPMERPSGWKPSHRKLQRSLRRK